MKENAIMMHVYIKLKSQTHPQEFKHREPTLGNSKAQQATYCILVP